MSDMDLFKTRQMANEGRRIYLRDPATGEKTSHWIHLLSQWSDSFQEARTEAARRAYIKSLGESDEEADENRKQELTAALIADWSFEEECNAENKVAFLREAPQIKEQIDQLAANDQYFFGNPSGGSSNGPGSSSDLASQTDQAELPGEST